MSKAVAIMFHAVGLADHRWSYARISDSPSGFEAKMAALSRRGYRSAFFKDLDPQHELNDKTVVPTFDDGYLDNWVHVLPVLERYGIRGTIFVNPDFVDPRPVVRPRSIDSPPQSSPHQAVDCCAGFLSWEELRQCESSGLLDIQSHALTHTWYFCGPEIVDFWRPACATEPNGPVWLLWNRFPEEKPHYLTRAATLESRIPYGTPIYEHGKALATRRYFPAPLLDELLPEFVARNGGASFFESPDWRKRLHATASAAMERRGTEGRYETDLEFDDRVRFELGESKRLLEERLDKQINSICWPGGSLTPTGLALARTLGYRRFTLPSTWQAHPDNAEHKDLAPRVGARLHLSYRGRTLGNSSATEFAWSVERAFGSRLHAWLGNSALLLRFARSYLRP